MTQHTDCNGEARNPGADDEDVELVFRLQGSVLGEEGARRCCQRWHPHAASFGAFHVFSATVWLFWTIMLVAFERRKSFGA